MKNIIPIFHCFDNNYVIPAAVAFYSLLENSNKEYYYELIVAHNNITEENQEKLKKNIEKFENGKIKFIKIDDFNLEWEKMGIKGHYSKEVLYKLRIPSILKEYDKVIVADVDVLYLSDISKDFIEYISDEENYLAGICGVEKISYIKKDYEKDFSKEEIEKLVIGRGYFFANLKKMREDNIEEKFRKSLIENSSRIRQAEQDILNLVCFPKIKKLPLRNMVCTYIYDLYDRNNIISEVNYNKKEIEEAYDLPVQLHYATSTKPWNNLKCTKSEIWFSYLSKTNFLKEFLWQLEEKIHPTYGGGVVKKLFKIFLPITSKRKIIITIEKFKKR